MIGAIISRLVTSTAFKQASRDSHPHALTMVYVMVPQKSLRGWLKVRNYVPHHPPEHISARRYVM